MNSLKKVVHNFWNQASCGEALYLSGADKVSYDEQALASISKH
jgi:hypothetical protein